MLDLFISSAGKMKYRPNAYDYVLAIKVLVLGKSVSLMAGDGYR